MEYELQKKRFTSECTPAYIEAVKKFVMDNIVENLASQRSSRGMFDALYKQEEWDEDTDLSMGASGKSMSSRRRF